MGHVLPANSESFFAATPGPLHTFSLTLNIISAAISLVVFVYGAMLSYYQRQIWRNPIIRIIVAAQFINFLRFVFRIILIDVGLTTDSACRGILFISDATSLLPVNLCVYCVVYLQLVVIHNLSPELRWPRVVALITATVLSVVPPSMVLYISPWLIRLDSICDISWIPEHRAYEFVVYTYAIWAYMPGVIGTISVLAISIHLVRTRRAIRHALEASAQDYGPSPAVARVGHADALQKTLLTIIWFPITPIISLWFNILLYTVAYYKQRTYEGLEYFNIVLLCLQSLLLGLPLLVNPAVRTALAKHIQEQRQARHTARSTTHGTPPPRPRPPPLPPRPSHDMDLDDTGLDDSDQ
ncbi:hypothetical protein H4R19_003264 [Coemansia spiralis]|nr:hypothetical protein H4R19_003264 [Coemansia spiralis]